MSSLPPPLNVLIGKPVRTHTGEMELRDVGRSQVPFSPRPHACHLRQEQDYGMLHFLFWKGNYSNNAFHFGYFCFQHIFKMIISFLTLFGMIYFTEKFSDFSPRSVNGKARFWSQVFKLQTLSVMFTSYYFSFYDLSSTIFVIIYAS